MEKRPGTAVSGTTSGRYREFSEFVNRFAVMMRGPDEPANDGA